MTDEALDPIACVAVSASIVSRWFHGYVDSEDLRQEGHLWLLEHPERVEAYKGADEPRLAAWQLSRDLRGHMEKYARAEKAAYLGYNPGDEMFYSGGLIEAALPAALAGNLAPAAHGLEAGRGGSATTDGMDWPAIVLDVQRGYYGADLTTEERTCLVRHYAGGEAQADIANDLGVTQATVSRALSRAVGKVVDVLGGWRPRECWEDGCPDHKAA